MIMIVFEDSVGYAWLLLLLVTCGEQDDSLNPGRVTSPARGCTSSHRTMLRESLSPRLVVVGGYFMIIILTTFLRLDWLTLLGRTAVERPQGLGEAYYLSLGRRGDRDMLYQAMRVFGVTARGEGGTGGGHERAVVALCQLLLADNIY